MEKIYLDYAASTPLAEGVEEAMRPYGRQHFGNPGSLHYFGQQAMAVVDASRETIARIVGASFRELIFTASATEANNLALRGVIKRIKNQGSKVKGRLRIVTSQIEHESILETCRDLESEGVEVIYLPVDRKGFVDVGALKDALNERTVLVSIIYASNEIGTVQPITGISDIIRDFRESVNPVTRDSKSTFPLLHTDAAQAFQFLNVNVDRLGVDLMSISSQKIYGPKGVGALYVKKEGRMSNSNLLLPVTTGGGQEFGLRAATENVPGIAGFAKAAELIEETKLADAARMWKLRDYFWERLKKARPHVELNGPSVPEAALFQETQEKFPSLNRLPNNLNVFFPGRDAKELLVAFDMAGVAVSSGSACSVRSPQPSYVVTALGFGGERAGGSIRFSLGRPTTKTDLDNTLKRIINII